MYVAGTLNMGTLRVTTLHDCRRQELGEGIADPEEGKKIVEHFISSYDPGSDDLESEESRKHRQALETLGIMKIPGGAKGPSFKDVMVSRGFDTPNLYMLCMSAVASKDVMSEFEGADSCYEIDNIIEFLQCLTTTLNSHTPVIFHGMQQVEYSRRDQVWNERDWGANPAFLKDPKYADQQEVRAFWIPLNGEVIQPLNLVNYRLGRYCTPVKI